MSERTGRDERHVRGSTITRRRFVRNAGAAMVVTGEMMSSPVAAPAGRRRRPRPTVAVLGGGIAGLTAAHELGQRGFDVTVYERTAWGGRIRGSTIAGTGTGGRRPLPHEHSFHVYFGTYRNFADTLRRIPFGASSLGAFGNLTPLGQGTFGTRGKRDLVLPLGLTERARLTPAQIHDTLVHVLVQADLPPDAAAWFADRLAVYLSSCDARRSGELERVTWADFIGIDRYTRGYRELIGEFPQFLFATKPERTSAKFMAWVLTTFLLYSLLGFGNDGAVARMLDAPVDEALIDPWLAALRAQGVHLRLHRQVTRLHVVDGRVRAVRIQTRRGRRMVTADWFVLALPLRQARRLLHRDVLAMDPRLAGMAHLETTDSNGIQYHLRARCPIRGVYVTLGQPWAPIFIGQSEFWRQDVASTWGDGAIRDVLSAAIANWQRPAVLYGKQVADCSPDEYAREIWEQIKRCVNKPGDPPRLTDDMLHSWRADDAITRRDGRLHNELPLVAPIVGTERYRPGVVTKIANLVLCGDYVAGEWEIGHMEAANHSGRRAANAVLDASSCREERAATTGPYRPPEWEPLRSVDEQRYARGEPNLFDAPDMPSAAVASLLGAPGPKAAR